MYVLVLIGAWLLIAALAYYNTKATFQDDVHVNWDKATKEFTIICALLLAPVFLLISLEIRLMALIGTGLASNRTRRFRNVQ